MLRRTYEPPASFVDDVDRALPYIRQVVLEVCLLLDDSRLLDSVRERVLRGVVSRAEGGHCYSFRFDPERGRHRNAGLYVINAFGWALYRDRRPQEAIWFEGLSPASVLEALREHRQTELVRDVLAT